MTKTISHLYNDYPSAQAAARELEAAGKVTGDAKLKSEGAADKAAGKVQNAVGE